VTGGHRDAVAGKELLGLVFVEVHGKAAFWLEFEAA
jgi:hypothetical protein